MMKKLSIEELFEKIENLNEKYPKLDDENVVSNLIIESFLLRDWGLYESESGLQDLKALDEVINKGRTLKIEINKKYIPLPFIGNDDPIHIKNLATFAAHEGRYPHYTDFIKIPAYEYEILLNSLIESHRYLDYTYLKKCPIVPNSDSRYISSGTYIIDSIKYDGNNLDIGIDKPYMESLIKDRSRITKGMEKVLSMDEPCKHICKDFIYHLPVHLNVPFRMEELERALILYEQKSLYKPPVWGINKLARAL